MLQLNHVSKSYRCGEQSIAVLDRMDFTVEEGQTVAVVGPSGSGKSTLLHIMSGLDVPDSGSVCVDGDDLKQMPEKKRSAFRLRQFGFVFQSYFLVPTLNAYDNIILPKLAASRRVEEEDLNEILQTLGLEERRYHFPHQLSGGEQQRVAIARAIVNHPKIVFADEPTGNLDDVNSKLVMDMLTGYSRRHGQALIYVTHDRTLIPYADRVLRLEKGGHYEEEPV